VIRGANLVRAAIASAFGPYGASVAISQPFGYDRQLKRGSQIAQGIKSSNPLEEKGIDQIRSTTFAVQGLAGDFSKLAAILAAGLMSRGQELIEKGLHPQDILRGLEHAVDRVCNHLDDSAKPTSHSDLVGVATAAASGNDRVGVLVAEAVNRAGAHGVITIETADQRDTVLEIEEGLRFDRGYLSDYFVTDAESMSCVLENCLVLCYQKRIQMMKELLPLLEQVARSQQALLIIAEDIEGEALATLTVNKIKGTLRCVAVKAPGEGERRKAILEDIAILTGGMFVSHELGRPLTDVGIANLGTASRVVVTKDVTTITGGLGAQGAIAERIRSIQTQISCAISPYDREKLQERLARLAGSVVVLKAGGVSEGDLLQEKYRSESALNSAVSAMTHGTVIGGGVALLRAGMALRKAQTNNEVDAQTMEALAAVLEEPIRQLIENAQRSPTQVLSEITKSASECLGFNSSNGKVEDLGAASVLDPANSVKQALRMAASHAGSVLQTGTWDLSPPLNPIQTPGQAHIES
jgi:chaperonin GroEL